MGEQSVEGTRGGGGGDLVTKSCRTLATPWTVALQAPLSMGFSTQEYWSGLSFPTPGEFPDPGIKAMPSALAGGFFTTAPPGKPQQTIYIMLKTVKRALQIVPLLFP